MIIAFALTLALSEAPGAAGGPAACRTILATGEITKVKAGDILFLDAGGLGSVKVASVDPGRGEVCGEAAGSSQCFSAEGLYTARALASCRRGADPTGLGRIYLKDDPPTAAGEPAATRPGPDERR